jgi:hypothetical protein
MTVQWSTRVSRLAVFAAVALAFGSIATVPSYAADDAEMYVLQGLPGKTADVSIDGHSVAKGVKTAAFVGPFKVHSGQRTVTIKVGGKVLIQRKVTLSAKSSSDVVVHLPAEGKGDATITAYKNDLSAVTKDKAALTVAHTAAVPPADIRVNGKVLFANIANGQSLSLVVPVATYEVGIVPAGKAKPFYFGPVDLTLKADALNRVFAIGDPQNHTMNVAVQVLTTGSTGSGKPSKVNTGTGGQAVNQAPKVFINLLR